MDDSMEVISPRVTAYLFLIGFGVIPMLFAPSAWWGYYLAAAFLQGIALLVAIPLCEIAGERHRTAVGEALFWGTQLAIIITLLLL